MQYTIPFRHLFFLLLLFWGNNALAQELLISPGTIEESGFGYAKVIGQDQDGYFVLLSNLSLNIGSDRVGFKNRKYKVSRFNYALEKKWSKQLEPASDDGSVDAVTFFNENIIIVSSEYNKQQLKVKYTISTCDYEGNIITNASVVEFSPVVSDYEKSITVLSNNRQQFALVMREFTNDSSQKLFTVVMDTSFQILSQKSFIIPFTEKKFDVEGFTLSDNGDMGVLGFHAEKIKFLSSKRKYDYYLYTSPATENVFREFKIASDKTINEIGIAFDNFNNQIVLAGFYFERETVGGAGIFYATLDIKSNNELIINTKAIGGQGNTRLKGERSLASGIGIVGYPIERIVIRNDGGALIVAEAAYTTDYSYYDSFSQSYSHRIEYHFENVVIISVNKDGTIDWSSIVDKDQVSLDDNGVFSSFSSLLNSEQLLILFNDDISRRNKITRASVNNKGELMHAKPIAKSDGLMLLPRSGKQVSENEILVPAYKKRDLHLIRFGF